MKTKTKIILLVTLISISIIYFVISTIQIEKGSDRGFKMDRIAGINHNGKPISLDSIKNKYILIDFWASWCSPCRKFNPDLVEFYAAHKNVIEIFSISLDDNSEKWKQAIIKDGLIWEYHICDLKGWASPTALKYNIDEIPNNILVDKNGTIIGRNLNLDDIIDLCK